MLRGDGRHGGIVDTVSSLVRDSRPHRATRLRRRRTSLALGCLQLGRFFTKW